jgi:hypothetical protein
MSGVYYETPNRFNQMVFQFFGKTLKKFEMSDGKPMFHILI